jgi:hypothetical protein
VGAEVRAARVAAANDCCAALGDLRVERPDHLTAAPDAMPTTRLTGNQAKREQIVDA